MDIKAGQTFKYAVSYNDYPCDEYNAILIIINSDDKITINAEVEDEEFVFSATPVSTTDWVAGNYSYQVIVFITEGEVVIESYVAEEGLVTIYPDLLSAEKYDTRTHVKKILDALRAALENKATAYQLQYSIAGRQIIYMTHMELIRAINIYERKYQLELDRLNGTNSTKINMRFV